MDNHGEMSGSHSQQGSDKSRWQKIGGLAQLKQLPNSYWAEPKEETEPILEAPVEQVGQQTPEPEKQLPWQERYPDLHKEMIDNHVPMDPKRFKEEGYEFIKHDDGSRHVAYPTPEYTEWLKADPENRGPRPLAHHEELAERTERERWSPTKEAAAPLVSEFVDRLVSEENDEHRELKESLSDINLDRFKEKVVSRVAFLVDKERYILDKMQMLGGERKVWYRKREFSYEDSLSRALESGKTDLSDEACGRYLSEALPDIVIDDRPSNAERVAAMMLKESQKGLIGDEEFQKIVTANEECKGRVLRSSICLGTFPIQSEGADKLLSDYAESDSDQITRYAFQGYRKIDDQEKREGYDAFFGISEYLVNNPESGLIKYEDGSYGLSRASELHPFYSTMKLPSELSTKIEHKYDEELGKLVEHFRDDSDLLAAIEQAKEHFPQKTGDLILRKIIDGNIPDINAYIDTKSVYLEAPHGCIKALSDKREDEWQHFVKSDEIANAIFKEHPLDVDYESVLRAVAKACLYEGTHHLYPGDSRKYIIPQTAFFESESFLENQEKLGIDFSDPEIMEPAFNGFLNVLSADTHNWRGGEKTEQLNWYYNNIFANDPDKFFMMEKAMRATSDNIRLKNRFTRFYKTCPEAKEDRERWESEERLRKEINNRQRAINPSDLVKLGRGELRKFLDDYKKELLKRMWGRPKVIIDHPDDGKDNPPERGPSGGGKEREIKEPPFDFTFEKICAFERYEDYINNNYPDSDIEEFRTSFAGKTFNDAYIAFSFIHPNGKRCVIAEGLADRAAMYLGCFEVDDDYLQLFDSFKREKRQSSDPNVVAIDHWGKKYFDKSLDTVYQKAFLFFETGDKSVAHPSRKEQGGRKAWNERFNKELPAWPIDITGEAENYPDDLEKYKQWQGRQAVTEQRLKDAIERGGVSEYERERERIAEENYERIQEEQS